MYFFLYPLYHNNKYSGKGKQIYISEIYRTYSRISVGHIPTSENL